MMVLHAKEDLDQQIDRRAYLVCGLETETRGFHIRTPSSFWQSVAVSFKL
jgi:hypothetical protein